MQLYLCIYIFFRSRSKFHSFILMFTTNTIAYSDWQVYRSGFFNSITLYTHHPGPLFHSTWIEFWCCSRSLYLQGQRATMSSWKIVRHCLYLLSAYTSLCSRQQHIQHNTIDNLCFYIGMHYDSPINYLLNN